MPTLQAKPSLADRLFAEACVQYAKESHEVSLSVWQDELSRGELRTDVATWTEAQQLIAVTQISTSPVILCRILEAMEQGHSIIMPWTIALALQNPAISEATLFRFMRFGREEYYQWKGHSDLSSRYYMFEAGLKNPLLLLMSLENPARYVAVLQSFGL